MRGRTVTALLGVLTTATALLPAMLGPASASAAAPIDTTRTGPAIRPVDSVRYDLGDRAFHPAAELDYDGDNELNGVVYFPTDLGRGTHPLVMIEHGQWHTCADARAQARMDAAKAALPAAEQAGNTAEVDRLWEIIAAAGSELSRWPCTAGTPQLPSYLGYEYLGRRLASLGFVVVSIGTNGINATSFGQGATVYQTRAALLNRQLAMWQRLAATGGGPLRGRFVDSRTHRPRNVDFRGHVDLTRVGTVGHSMGGGGVMQHVADGHQQWPAGVTVKAVFTLAPAGTFDPVEVTTVPFAVMWGTCDAVNTGGYVESTAGRNRAPIYKYTLAGGNHDFYNTQWSPDSGQVGGVDDATPGTRRGYCKAQFPPDRDGAAPAQPDQKALTESQQRQVTEAYAAAFFLRHLSGQRQYDPLLQGAVTSPGLPAVVGVRYAPPLAR
ncbi:hypothetical protein ACIBTV_04570 [Micromonospora sp. NPDC049366]|uniref:hypothetical protein n=1 Tax=Micromonospora sp. NPDC049366 TaxID=3364271 RepID=UPI0037BCF9CB